MGFYKFKMAAFKLVILTLLFSTTLELTAKAQKNVWRDDRAAVFKADTSLVKIGEGYYQKIIAVSYKEITEETFDDRIDELKTRKEDLKTRFNSERERYLKQIEQVNEELEAERVFVQATKKEMRWLDKEEKEAANPKKNEKDLQDERRVEFFKTKPKKD